LLCLSGPMQINLEKIRDHADQRFAGAPATVAEAIESFKRFLKLETERLRMRHRFGLGGREIAQGRSYLADVVVSRACQMAAAELGPSLKEDLSGCAVVALGGYGRRELAPFSDVDLLFLHPDRLSPAIKTFVEKALLLLWDIGLSVGHSFRSVAECVSMAQRDLPSRNAMSEARLVAGNGSLFQRFVAQLDDVVYGNRRASESFLTSMRAEMEERLARFGGAVCIQEPNVKESAGGLRDLHTVGWVGHARFGCRGIDSLLAQGYVSASEHATARKAYDFIARIRNEAHFVTGRRTDLLTLDLQPVLAGGLGYGDKGGIAASELFMRDYYRRAQELRRFCENFLLRAGAGTTPARRLSLRPKVVGPRGRYEIRSGQLVARAKSPAAPDDPFRLLEVFEVAQENGVRISDELKLVVNENLRLVDRRFRSSPEACRAFVALLGRPGRLVPTLRPMHETGFLGRFLPEFERITFLVQHDFFHRYTVDEHTLKALEALDDVATSKHPDVAPFTRVLDEVEDPARLALGILLHDIGKGRGGQHVPKGARIAESVCERLHLDADTAGDVLFLVQKHLVMSQVSTRRDLSDTGLIEGFAETVGTLDRLNMLLVLTFADHCGVGPGIWNEWKGALLWELYTKTREHLTGEHATISEGDRRARLLEKVVEGLFPEFLRSDVEHHLSLFPERYLRAASPEAISRHFQLAQELGSKPLMADWRSAPAGRHTVLTVCTRDAPGLLARLAGTLTGHGLSILSLDAFTRSDGIVLDTFKVCDATGLAPVRPERWKAIEADLAAAVTGTHDVDAAVARGRAKAPRRARRRPPTRPAVHFDSVPGQGATVVEVRAEDEPGLVYRIASTLSGLRLDIVLAKIATEKTHAYDVFYVTEATGQPLSAETKSKVEEALLFVLDPGPRSTS
jgi:[protein-PII] uridylyltransferase